MKKKKLKECDKTLDNEKKIEILLKQYTLLKNETKQLFLL